MLHYKATNNIAGIGKQKKYILLKHSSIQFKNVPH
jgi:hypothetical protein